MCHKKKISNGRYSFSAFSAEETNIFENSCWQVSVAISVELEGWTSLAAARPILNTHRNTLKIQKHTLTHTHRHRHTDINTLKYKDRHLEKASSWLIILYYGLFPPATMFCYFPNFGAAVVQHWKSFDPHKVVHFRSSVLLNVWKKTTLTILHPVRLASQFEDQVLFALCKRPKTIQMKKCEKIRILL